jgi:hypothetical protein
MNISDLEKCKIAKNEYKTTNVNGHTILYTESKNRDKKHILFIHGLGSSLFGWRDIPDALSEHFHTISIDLIGVWFLNYKKQECKRLMRWMED